MNREQPRTMEGGFFTPKGWRHRSPLPFMTRPCNDSKFAVFASDQDGFEAYILNPVLEKIYGDLVRASPDETIGLLAGRVLRDSAGPYTLVLASQDAHGDETEATPGHVRITANGHANLRQRLEKTAYGLDFVGWYHSHPRFPARFSSVDVTEQSTLKDPNHLGIVVSGIDQLRPYGVYRGPAAQLLAPQTITQQVVTPASLSPVVSPNQIVVQNSAPRQGISSGPIVTYERERHTPQGNSPVSRTRFREHFSRRRVLLVALALTVLLILIWTDYRIYSIENKLAALADIKPTVTTDDRARASASPLVGDSKATENSSLTPAIEKPTASSEPKANPKLPMSKSADESKTKKARTGSDKPGNANRSQGNAGVRAGNTGAARRSATPNPTPRPSPLPPSRPLSTPSARPQ